MRRFARYFAVLVALGLALPACGDRQEQPAPAQRSPETTPSPATTPAGTTAATTAGTVTGPLPAGVTAEMVQQGRQIFGGAGNCYTCHGADATGGPLAPNLTDNQWLWVQASAPDQTYQELITLIRTGVAQPKEHPAPMPPMGGANLSEEQLRAVAAYVYSLSHGRAG